jgi:ketosteroid isomerase-like protein
MKILLITAALVSAQSADAQPAKAPSLELPANTRAAGAVVEAFHLALGRGDTRAASALLTDDALIFESGGVERGKTEYAAYHLAADAAFAKATARVVSRRSGRAEGSTAWIGSESTTKGSFKNKPINSVSTETMILRRDRSGWRIAHVHWSSANAK